MLEPISKTEWDERKASHLLDRTGFGATPKDIRTSAQADPFQLVDELFSFQASKIPPLVPAWVNDPKNTVPIRPKKDPKLQNLPPEELKKALQAKRREEMIQIAQLRGWWIERMLTTPWPLQEKLTLFWHGHFATSVEKVKFPYAMYVQNQTFRRHAAGNWEEILLAVSKDPAMLLYLDNAKSFSGAPNENYARELMELFTLGEGHYTETDIQQSARAFTGWSIDPEEGTFLDRAFRHDRGMKTFMGETGNFDGSDIIRIILKQPQAARFIMKKLWTYFAYGNPEPELMDELAQTLTKNSMDFGPTLRTVFLSKAFYSDKAIRQQIKSPVQWLVGLSKMCDSPAPHFVIANQMLSQLGQSLFQPPNVKGWDGGLAWITEASLVDRYRFSDALFHGGNELKGFLGQVRKILQENQTPQSPAMTSPTMMGADMQMSPEVVINHLSQPTLDPDKVFAGMESLAGEAIFDDLSSRFLQNHIRPQDKARMLSEIPAGKTVAQMSHEERIHVILSVVNTPYFQLT